MRVSGEEKVFYATRLDGVPVEVNVGGVCGEHHSRGMCLRNISVRRVGRQGATSQSPGRNNLKAQGNMVPRSHEKEASKERDHQQWYCP